MARMKRAVRPDGAVRKGPQGPGHGRTVAGVVLIAGAAIVGLVAGREPPGTPAWVLARPVAADSEVSAADLVPAEVRLPDGAALWPGGTAPQGVARRSLPAGQPLMAADLGPTPAGDVRAVSLTLPPERLPAALQVGDEVDVWVRGGGAPQLALTGVAVAGIQSDPALAQLAQVSVRVAAADAEAAVAAALADDVVLVRRS